jgi:predicted nucleic acid-binding protein
MPDNFVLDASAAVKLVFTEIGSEDVRECLAGSLNVIAPDFVLLEIASVAAKKHRRREVAQARAQIVIADAPELFTELASTANLAIAAGEISIACMISPYDAAYVVLAQRTGYTLLTADRRLTEAITQLQNPPNVWLIRS